MTAVVAVVLFLVGALIIDLGLARDVRRQSQNAADASALAGGNALYSTDTTCVTAPCFAKAVTAAQTYAQQNFGVTSAAWAGCDDPTPLAYVPPGVSGDCISFNSVTRPTQIRVRVPQRVTETGLGRIAGVDRISISTVARAALDPGGRLDCGLCVLGSGAVHDIQNGDVTVTQANIHFNGSVSVSPNGMVTTPGRISVEGTAAGSLMNYQPDPVTNQAPISDPLATLALPPATITGLAHKADPCLNGPGIYAGMNLRNRNCVLMPGLYVIRSGTWDLAGNANTLLTGTGVTLFFTCSNSSGVVTPCTDSAATSSASLDASGNGQISLAPQASGPLEGVSIIYDRGNASDMHLSGNGFSSTAGTIYAPSGRLRMSGNGCAVTTAAVVVHDLGFDGNPSCLNIAYNQVTNFKPPPANLHLDQ